jgi:hypothetical protein
MSSTRSESEALATLPDKSASSDPDEHSSEPSENHLAVSSSYSTHEASSSSSSAEAEIGEEPGTCLLTSKKNARTKRRDVLGWVIYGFAIGGIDAAFQAFVPTFVTELAKIYAVKHDMPVSIFSSF